MPQPKTQAQIDAERAATKAALDKLYAKAYVPPKKLSEIGKPSMAQNYQTLGRKMMQSGRRAMGKEEKE